MRPHKPVQQLDLYVESFPEEEQELLKWKQTRREQRKW